MFESKRKLAIFVIILILLFIASASGTYAYFTSTVEGEGTEQVFIAGDVVLNFEDSNSTVLEGVTPGDYITKTFRVENNTDKKAYYDLIWSEYSNGFINNELYIELECKQYINYGQVNQEESGTCSSLLNTPILTENDDILSNVFIAPGKTQVYNTKVTFIETGSDQSYNLYKTFNGVLGIEGSIKGIAWYNSCAGKNTLNCKIVNSSTLQSDAYLVYELNQGSGLYYTYNEEDTNDVTNDGIGDRVFYYRGNVTNNYVTYGGFCWRIIRTNEDSSVRMRYAGPLTGGACTANSSTIGINATTYPFNEVANDNAYIGYMYGTPGSSSYELTHENINDSSIKKEIEKWFDVFLKDYINLISDQVYCNDRSISNDDKYSTSSSWNNSKKGFGLNVTAYGITERTLKPNTADTTVYDRVGVNPTYKCQNENDKFTVSPIIGNGMLTYPIGLMTGDEAVFAGSFRTGAVASSFLIANTNYFTMSAYLSTTTVAYDGCVSTSGTLVHCNNSTPYYAYPVISIKPSARVISGTGIISSPYVIQ